MTLMIALVGGQPMPNLLPVRHYHPERVLLIYTPITKKVYDRLQAVLQKETNVDGLETDAYNIAEIAKTLNLKLSTSELVNQSALFNITGGTKTMSLAAYQVARQQGAPVLYMESEGKRNRIYHYIWENQQLRAKSNELLPESMKLSDLFDVHLGVGNWKENGPAPNEGGRFEAALADTLRAHGYEVMNGVRTLTDQIDIDVAVRYENQLGIIEAKMGDNGRNLDGIKQLSTAAQLFGIYTKKFYAITVSPSRSHEALKDAANIQTVSLPSYAHGTNMFTANDTEKLITIVDKALKG